MAVSYNYFVVLYFCRLQLTSLISILQLLAFHGKLYIALEDFKERYRNAARGPGLIKAYLRSLENSRKVNHIEFFLKDNKTVEFTIDGSRSRDILTEVKQDIYGELCTVGFSFIHHSSLSTCPCMHQFCSSIPSPFLHVTGFVNLASFFPDCQSYVR